MGRRTCLDANQARREISKKCADFRSPQLPSDDYFARAIDAADLEHVLRAIEADRGNLHDGRLLVCGVTYRRPRQALDAVQQGPSTPSTTDCLNVRLSLSISRPRATSRIS